jgi:hypothetical protein
MAKKAFKSAGITIDVSMLGDEELTRNLNKMEGMGRTGLFAGAAKESMKPVLKDVQAGVPVDTGNLRKAFRVRSIKRMRGRRARGMIGARLLMPTREMVKIPANAKNYYPARQEFGFNHTNGTFVPAKRFMRDSLYRNRSVVFAAMRRNLWASIRKALTRKGMAIPEEVARNR